MQKKTSFVLSLLSFICGSTFAQSNHSDQSTSLHLCSTNPLTIEQLSGFGVLNSEVNATDCFTSIYPETNSIWLDFQIQNSGNLAFTLFPNYSSDDFDFVLFKVNELSNTKEYIRCAMSGKILGEEQGDGGFPCTGATGLSTTSITKVLGAGCSDFSENFAEYVSALSGEKYYLFINNYLSSNGFRLEFTGDVSFKPSNNCNDYLSNDNGVPLVAENGVIIKNLRPNPTTNWINVEVESNITDTGVIQFIDAKGKTAIEKQITLQEGLNDLQFHIESLEKGIWFLRLNLEKTTSTLRFVKM